MKKTLSLAAMHRRFQTAYPRTPMVSMRFLRFASRCWRHSEDHRKHFELLDQTGMAAAVLQDPKLVERVQRGYLSNVLSPTQRRRLAFKHFRLMLAMDPADFSAIHSNEGLEVLNWQDGDDSHRFILQHHPSTGREGELTLTWFRNGQRIAMAAFNLADSSHGQRIVIAGGMQGLNDEAGAAVYKDITKRMHGLRPISLMVQLLQFIAQATGATRILAVADAHHAKFPTGHRRGRRRSLRYNAIWEEHEGEAWLLGMYRLPGVATRKTLEEISSNKRSMYRKRFAMLDGFRETLFAVPALACIREAKQIGLVDTASAASPSAAGGEREAWMEGIFHA